MPSRVKQREVFLLRFVEELSLAKLPKHLAFDWAALRPVVAVGKACGSK